MSSYSARIESKKITDWDSFHSVFSETMGFPDFYGRNMNAWIDCLTYGNDNMTRFNVAPGGMFHLEIADAKDFAQRLPDIFQALIECSAFVNQRRVAVGDPPILALVLL
jgi:RNAse (barnase) inhibitor barstar